MRIINFAITFFLISFLFLPLPISAKMVSIDSGGEVAWVCDDTTISIKIRSEDKAKAKVLKYVFTGCSDLKFRFFCNSVPRDKYSEISKNISSYLNENDHINLLDLLEKSGLVACKGL